MYSRSKCTLLTRTPRAPAVRQRVGNVKSLRMQLPRYQNNPGIDEEELRKLNISLDNIEEVQAKNQKLISELVARLEKHRANLVELRQQQITLSEIAQQQRQTLEQLVLGQDRLQDDLWWWRLGLMVMVFLVFVLAVGLVRIVLKC